MSPFEQITQAIRDDDQARVLEILQLADPHARDHDGISLAEWALGRRDPAALRLLLQRGATLEPEYLVSAAIVCGDFDRVRALSHSADLNRVDGLGNTPLMVATRAGAIEIIKVLLSHGADPEVRNKWGGNILETAAVAANPRVLEILLHSGADVNAENQYGDTPLLEMLSRQHKEISPDRVESVRLLVRAGARLYYRSEAKKHDQGKDKCALCMVAGAYDGFSEGHASVLALLFAFGGPELIHARGGPALYQAVSHGNLPAVEALLRAGISPDTLTEGGQSLITIAVRNGRADSLAALLQHGARVPPADKHGGSLLMEARKTRNARIAELLASYDWQAEYPRSPTGLADAITAGDLEGVERLLDAGMDVNTELPLAGTAMSLAAGHGHAVIVRALAARGAKVNHRSNGKTPLSEAVYWQQLECVRTLIELGCNVNAKPPSPIHPGLIWDAVHTCQLDIVRLLLDAGVKPYLAAAKRLRPVERSTKYSYSETMDVLLSAMHDPKKRRATLKRCLRNAIYNDSLGRVRYLLERVPDLYDEPDAFGEHPIEAASARGNPEILRFLLSRGPCTLEGGQRQQGWEQTPLMSAVLTGRLEAVRVLVEAGANVRAKKSGLGYTPIMFACYLTTSTEYPQIVDLLLDYGADLDARTNDGRTALMMAVQDGLYGVVDALLRRGADLSARNRQGRDVFDLAQERGHPRLLELLRQHRPV